MEETSCTRTKSGSGVILAESVSSESGDHILNVFQVKVVGQLMILGEIKVQIPFCGLWKMIGQLCGGEVRIKMLHQQREPERLRRLGDVIVVTVQGVVFIIA